MKYASLLVAALAVNLTFPDISVAQNQEQGATHVTILHAGQLLARWDLPIETDKSAVISEGRMLTVSDGFRVPAQSPIALPPGVHDGRQDQAIIFATDL